MQTKTGDICKGEVIVARTTASLVETARLMRENHVGSVVVVDGARPRIPVGVLTDRDIAIEVVARGLDPLTLTAADVMTGQLVTARADDSILNTLEVMRRAGVRRVPVLSADGTLHGIVTLDDLLGVAAAAMDGIAAAIGSERAGEARLRQ